MTTKTTPRLTEEQYREAENELAGLCLECGKLVNHGGVEPDAEDYECEECGEPAVQGIMNALLAEQFTLVTEEPTGSDE